MKQLHVLIADDHPLVLEAMVSLLKGIEGIHTIGTASNGKEVLELLTKVKTDILITDIEMPDINGAQLTKQVKKNYPNIKIVVLTMYEDRASIATFMKHGVSAYLFKSSKRQEIENALNALIKGGTYFPEEVKSSFFSTTRTSQKKKAGHWAPQLSKRESEVLKLIAEEYTTQQIADELFISTHTVESHRQNLLHRLQAKNTAGLIKQAIYHGLIE